MEAALELRFPLPGCVTQTIRINHGMAAVKILREKENVAEGMGLPEKAPSLRKLLSRALKKVLRYVLQILSKKKKMKEKKDLCLLIRKISFGSRTIFFQ